MKRTHVAVLAALVLPLAGCGSDEPAPPDPPSAGGDTPSESAEAGASVEAAADPGDLTDDDVAAIADTIVTLDLEGGCDLVTDKYLEDQTFDSNPRRACTTYEAGFVEKQYAAEDLLISDVDGDAAPGDRDIRQHDRGPDHRVHAGQRGRHLEGRRRRLLSRRPPRSCELQAQRATAHGRGDASWSIRHDAPTG